MKRTITQSGLDKSDSSSSLPATHLKASHPPPHRQRQPQTSCDFCRLKKLKCDRAKPCSTCVARRRPCNGPPTPEATLSSSDGQITPDSEGTPRAPIAGITKRRSGLFAVTTDAPNDVLDRLRRLEEAVFGPPDASQPALGLSRPTANGDGMRDVSPNTPITLQESEQTDCATACDSVSPESGYHNVRFRFAESSRLPGTSSSSLTDDLPSHTMLGTSVKSIWLPSKEGILALLDDYLQGQHMFLGIIDPRAVRSLISHVYSDLPHRKSLELSQVALLLAIAATSAFFWDKEDGRLKYQFSSAFDAANWSVFWRNSAWDLLDQLRRDVAGSLEELQATCILAHLISQIEGCPSRYRRLQGNAITIAREISLHVVDAPNAFLPWDRHGESGNDITLYQTRDSESVKEIKRRVWWHLAGTDWLLSVMGGPLYKSYTVNPLHMNVRYPRNINDEDLQSLVPWPNDDPREWPDTTVEPPTTFTYSLLRLRVAEICYKIVDALPPICSRHGSSSGGIEQLPYDEIVRIDQLFDQVLTSFPASYGLGAPISPGAPADLDLQRQVLLLFFHARRARIFRPFLQLGTQVHTGRKKGSRQNGPQSWDLKYERFSRVCRDSARIVLAITSSLVGRGGVGNAAETFGAVGQQHSQRPKIVHRSGLILMHLFMACVILATDPTLSPSDPDQTNDVSARRRELAQGCFLLKMAGERSSMASGLMETLTMILNRHKLRVFCNQDRPDLEKQHSLEQFSPVEPTPLALQQQNNHVPSQQPFTGSFITSDIDDREAVSDIWDIDRLQERIRAQHAQQLKHKPAAAAPVQSQSLRPAEKQSAGYQVDTPYAPQIPSPAQSEILPLDGLWKDLVDAASGSFGGDASFQNSNMDGQLFGGNFDDGTQWDHLFADLEYFVGPS
ncbi:hypothetical protein QBC37DRAFT_379277 [Rhypophila decipiens]|uniref:Zn(2)-C6 fungal-type domain-containing protein n=1 Tax=Rhypophila decipiens TaxID=261697 RepID=A0AAN6XWJ8_9PEZI|nr:hypothetical protein QBC37DRAFT_379277 [Rhypophila decipiens]